MRCEVSKEAKPKPYEEFFESFGEYRVKLRKYGLIESVSVEELFQAFKARLIDELVVDNPSFQVLGLLKDRGNFGDREIEAAEKGITQ